MSAVYVAEKTAVPEAGIPKALQPDDVNGTFAPPVRFVERLIDVVEVSVYAPAVVTAVPAPMVIVQAPKKHTVVMLLLGIDAEIVFVVAVTGVNVIVHVPLVVTEHVLLQLVKSGEFFVIAAFCSVAVLPVDGVLNVAVLLHVIVSEPNVNDAEPVRVTVVGEGTMFADAAEANAAATRAAIATRSATLRMVHLPFLPAPASASSM